jgi:hypothetical protein
MRLIDADALNKMLVDAQTECKRNGGNFRVGVLSNVRENIANVPTIDAIPVEWLEAHSREYYEDWGTEPVTVENALREWRKEQEAKA